MSSSEARRGLAGGDAEAAGDGFLMVEEQSVLAAGGEQVQTNANVPQEGFQSFQLQCLAAGDVAAACQIVPGFA
jgi:hypothetical protein